MSSNESSSVSSSYVERSSVSDSTSKDRSDSSVSSTTGSSRTNLSKEEQEELAAAETRLVRRSRLFFVSLLLALAVAAGAVTGIILKNEEDKDFSLEFHDFAYEIDDVSHHKAHTIHGTVEGVAHTITSLGDFTNADWPHFTIPHFHQRSNELLFTADADFVAVSPIVGKHGVASWENYTAENNQWLEDPNTMPKHIYPLNLHDEYHVPVWQTSPTEDAAVVNFDLFSNPTFHRIFDYVLDYREPVLTEAIDITSLFGPNAPNSSGHPQSMMIQPIFRAFEGEQSKDIVALLIVVLPWDLYFTNLLHKGAKGIHVTLKDTCGDEFSYEIDGPTAHYVGEGDLHDAAYDDLLFVSDFEPFPWYEERDDNDPINCHYTLYLYPTKSLEDEYSTKKPAYMTFTVVMIFVFTTFAFATYDCLVRRRQKVVMESAMRSNAIVSSLFPSEVRDRLFSGLRRRKHKKSKEDANKRMGGLLPALTEAPKFRLNNFLNEADLTGTDAKGNPLEYTESKPIADLFPKATVMFADIVGFTAWSSVRDPTQVFMLLETLYRAFDHIAKRRRVFKVETIGDCYVAVAGLPEPRKDHAIVMSRFARECLKRMKQLTTKLEVALGPDTGDLTMRIGLHSGPVTAGVLRGEKSRFQLFGDTVNTASRMESTGESNRIQMSEETAALLDEAGKTDWFVERQDHVVAKGKGEMKTFWLLPKQKSRKTHCDHSEQSHSDDENGHDVDKQNAATKGGHTMSKTRTPYLRDSKTERMVGWSVDILSNLLKQIVAARNDAPISDHEVEAIAKLETLIGRSGTVQEEVTEFVALPKFNKESADQVQDPDKVQLPQNVINQLRLFVQSIAAMYRDNPFHNFEHASHVTMSVSKLLARIVAAHVTPEQKEQGQGAILSELHDRTYGITSDPITQFAVVFSALIHDVDHRGLPNFLLVKEEPKLAKVYEHRSVAEQNSVDLAWEKLMEPEFDALRACIYKTTTELKRFRQTVVNTVMATDIFDKDFAMLRKRRWERCFHDKTKEEYTFDDFNRRATIVIEHLIQASDVAHTMQHWQIYQKWNRRLFEEMYMAYRSGRSPKDPSATWYASEIGFFDNYIIPLAKKLKECGVFGVSSDEYLNYALDNRREWSIRGEEVVAESVARLSAEEDSDNPDPLDHV